MLALGAELGGVLERGARLACEPGLVPVVGAVAADPGNDQKCERDDEEAVLVPQLLELFAANFLIDFIEDIGHEKSPGRRFPARPCSQPGPLPRLR